MSYVYIASPFFTGEQLNTVKKIETALHIAGINYFSPRSEGVLIDMSDEDRQAKFEDIYESNIKHMDQASYMIANIDDRDVGTSFEVGYMCSLKKPIFSFSNNGYQINIMLRQSVVTHNTDIDNLIINIMEFKAEEPITIFDELTKDVT